MYICLTNQANLTQSFYNLFSVKFQGKMKDKNCFTNASIKSKIYRKLSKIAKNERHTISDQLDILIVSYENVRGDSKK